MAHEELLRGLRRVQHRLATIQDIMLDLANLAKDAPPELQQAVDDLSTPLDEAWDISCDMDSILEGVEDEEGEDDE